MITVTDVSWSRLPDGSYYVAWTEGGQRKARTFRGARAAYRYASFLDTAGRQPTPRESRAAERALERLERELEDLEEREAYEALASLGPLLRRRSGVRVRRYPKRVG